MADVTPTRGAALALAEEKHLIETGFGFLDEKRMLLAATLMKELAAWRELREIYEAQSQAALEALKGAIGRHGLEGVQLYPAAAAPDDPLRFETVPFLGIGRLQEPELAWPAAASSSGVDLSPEAGRCREAFAALLPLAARIAARQVNINRLVAEYRRTERRARALENVLLPETRARLAAITDFLDEADQEEAIRIRNAAGTGAARRG